MKNSFLIGFLLLLCMSTVCYSQKRPLDMAIIGEPLKEFSLPVYQGGQFKLSEAKGKNILLVFPRGYYDKNIWCDICTYEYLDFIDEFHNKKFDEKYNLDLVFVLPYDNSTINKWLQDLPEVYKSLEASENPPDTTTDQRVLTWVRFAKKHYPKTFAINRGETPVPYKILVDKDHLISERLEIFKTEWWGTRVEQNVPTIILLDKNGTVIYKYISQHTIDRPGSDYIKSILDAFLIAGK